MHQKKPKPPHQTKTRILSTPKNRQYKKISKRLKKFLKRHAMDSIISVLRNHKKAVDCFDFSTDDPTKISYYPKSKLPDDYTLVQDTDYRRSNGTHARIGRVLSGTTATNAQIQVLTALLSNRAIKNKLGLFESEEICYHYLSKNYTQIHEQQTNRGGYLFDSCMRGRDYQHLVKFYEDLGRDVVKILVLLDEEKRVVGRALIWQNVEIIKYRLDVDGNQMPGVFETYNGKYLDRAYTTNSNFLERFKTYAKDNFMPYYYNLTGVKELKIRDISIDDDTPLPYFDTFGYNIDGNFLSWTNYTHEFKSTEGKTFGEICGNGSDCCDQCNSSFDMDDEGGYNDSDGYICGSCGVVTVGGDFIPRNRATRINGEYYHEESDDIIYSSYYSCYILCDDMCETESGQYITYDDACETVDGEKCHKDDCININGEWYLEGDLRLTTDEDGNYILKSESEESDNE